MATDIEFSTHQKIFENETSDSFGCHCFVDGVFAGEGKIFIEHKKFAYIVDVWVTAEHRRKGIASKILNELEEVAKGFTTSPDGEKYFECVYLYVKATNKNAIDCYRRKGYAIVWNHNSELLMVKQLRGE